MGASPRTIDALAVARLAAGRGVPHIEVPCALDGTAGGYPAFCDAMRRLSPCVVMLGLLFVSACANDAGNSTPRAVIEAAAEERESLPVAVPIEVPQPYEFAGFGGGQQAADGTFVDSKWEYRQSEESREEGELPVISICVVRADHPWTCLPKDRALSVQRLDDVEAAVYAVGPGPAGNALPIWKRVELTSDWRRVEWLQR